MAELEALQEANQESPEVAQTDLLMAIPAPLRSELLTPPSRNCCTPASFSPRLARLFSRCPEKMCRMRPSRFPKPPVEPTSAQPLRYVNYPLPRDCSWNDTVAPQPRHLSRNRPSCHYPAGAGMHRTRHRFRILPRLSHSRETHAPGRSSHRRQLRPGHASLCLAGLRRPGE